ncbi:MAG TPA: GNAT family N-acetyltransferase [Patescibacteria group bacterium]|nr:GNAT family N-acetyltransferase [Patescibacteria group bacterium]
MLSLRAATAQDIDAITAIYAQHVLNGTGSFELEPPDAAEMHKRFDFVTSLGLPFLVAEFDGAVTGYAYAGPYRPRPAYRYTVETSIYIHPDRMGVGLGTALLQRLIADCEALGLRQMIAVVGDSANNGSLQLHRKFGFNETGILKDVGFKFGRWLDVVILQRSLGDGASKPPILPQ